MKVFVVGGSGLIGSSLIGNAPEGIEAIAPTRKDFDLINKGGN